MLDKLVSLMQSVSGTLEQAFWDEFLPLMRFFVRAMGADGPRRSFEDTILWFADVKLADSTANKALDDLKKYALISFVNSFRFGWISDLKVWNSAVLNEILNKIQTPSMLPVGLLFFDIRRLKALNARYGHDQTNLLLAKFTEVAKRSEYAPVLLAKSEFVKKTLVEIKEEQRALPKIFGRVFAGDEFALILPFSRSEKEIESWILESYLRDYARFLQKELDKSENSIPLKIVNSENPDEIGMYEDASISVDTGSVLLTKDSPELKLEALFDRVYEEQIKPKKSF